MTLFPLWLLRLLIYGSLVLCVVGTLGLLVLFLIDIKRRRLW